MVAGAAIMHKGRKQCLRSALGFETGLCLTRLQPLPLVLCIVQAYGANVRRQPWLMLGPPLLLFAVCVALGVYGVVAGATKEADDRRTVVYGAGLDWTASFRLSLEKAFTPLVTLSLFIRQDTNYTNFAPKFASLAQDLISTLPPNSIQELQVSPMGIISSIYPFFPDNSTGRFQQDIFNQSALRGGAVMTVEMRQLMLNGPLYLINGGNYAAIVRLPIFIQNASVSDTWGTNKTEPTDCPLLDESNPAAGTYCWNSVTHEKFWGFVTAILPLDDLRNGIDSRLDVLKQKGYLWRMTRPYTNTEANPLNLTDYTFANSSKWPSDPVVVPMVISNAEWTIYLEPDNGWTPSWLAGMIVLVVLGSTVLSLLVAVIMASWAQQKRLLSEVMESNAALAATTQHLEEEKLRLDALLVRQYNLLSVLGGGSRGNGKKDGGSVSEGGPMGNSISSKEGLTLERIELMRRQLAVNTNSSTADIESIQTLELLGEGTFGKVYKGLWRGTVVAVKTMMLPANMSGAEKREKMAVMEAAISSSLSHPNIVQTYTYAIKPIRDGVDTPGSSELLDGNLLVAGTNAESTMIKSSMNGGPKDKSTSTTSSVHSYEVRLVLEYCDRGCLRDALDDGVFMGSKGLNYCAVLDIAADVAKAMLHLHSLNVLHADLKARNVLLKSEGSHGSSVIAKVADFGLSLKMDHMETHISAVYQGTMTHMAPEILLDGHVSKAADVYAFGITMWELFTGGHAFAGVPRALMGHQIAKESLRPRFPEITPPGFRSLAERCWHPLVDMRPTFTEVLDSLVKLRMSEGSDTPALELHAQRARSASGGIALPPTAGISPHAPQGTDGAGRATVIHQRPLALPKIQEASGGTEDEDDSAGAPVPPEPCPTPAPLSPSARVPSAGSDVTGVDVGPTTTAPTPAPSAAHQSRAPLTGPGFTHGQGPVAGALDGGSLPSGIQVTNASVVGDSIWK